MFAGSASVCGLGRATPISLAQLVEQRRAGRQRRVALLEGQLPRSPRCSSARASTSSNWLCGQVVEPVEEDRPLAPEVAAVSPQQVDRLAGDPVGVDPAEPVAVRGVAGEQGGEVAEVGGALERRRRPPRRRPGSSPAACSSSSSRSKASRRSRARAAERRSGPSRAAPRLDRHRDGAAAAAPASARRPGGAPPAVATVRNSAPKVITAPPSAAPPAQSSRSKAKTSSTLGTTRTGSRSSAAVEAAPDQAGATRVRGPVDQVQRHLPSSMDGRAAHGPPQTAASRLRFAVYRRL